jgi:hypothetical protein
VSIPRLYVEVAIPFGRGKVHAVRCDTPDDLFSLCGLYLWEGRYEFVDAEDFGLKDGPPITCGSCLRIIELRQGGW